MRNLIVVLLTALWLAGCAAAQVIPVYQKIDKTVIIIPKTQESKVIGITYTKVEADGKINKVTKDFTIPNIYYPDDEAVICSRTKWNEDIENAVTDVELNK